MTEIHTDGTQLPTEEEMPNEEGDAGVGDVVLEDDEMLGSSGGTNMDATYPADGWI